MTISNPTIFITSSPNFAFGSIVPDRINMLQPGHALTTSGSSIVHDGVSKADNVNQWTIYDAAFNTGSTFPTISLGSLVTAPNNTMTAQKIVEATNNGFHCLQSVAIYQVSSIGNNGCKGKYRLAIIAAAGERTRIALSVSNNDFRYATSAGVTTVFDLANGVVGVAGTTYGSIANQDPGSNGYRWKPLGDTIKPLGTFGGRKWYLCMMDFLPGAFLAGGPPGIVATVLLDSGTGAAAESTSYTGDGASGLYVWRSNMLPPRAYALNNRRFFDDFTSLSTIDFNDTRAPGFNWYTHNRWINSGFNAFPPCNQSEFSISSPSILKIATAQSVMMLPTVAPAITGSGYVGSVWQPPSLFESSFAWDTTHQGPGAYWSHDVESMQNVIAAGCEIDFDENNVAGSGGNQSLTSMAVFSSTNANGVESIATTTPVDAYQVWGSGITYTATSAPNSIVFYQGTFYKCILNNTGQLPTNTTYWSAIAAPTPNTVFDFSQQNVYSNLWIPYVNFNDPGQILTFFNGIFVSCLTYGVDMLTNQGSIHMQDAEPLHMPVILSGGLNTPFFWDWVSVFGT